MSLDNSNSLRDERILILAPTGRDSEMSGRFLKDSGLQTAPCRDIQTLCDEMYNGCGLVLLAGEAVDAVALKCLSEALNLQPRWSDIPLIVLTVGGGASPGNAESLRKLGEAGNVTLIERPVRGSTLLSAINSALRARRRQYDVRDHLATEVRAVNALRHSEERLRIALDAAQLGAWQLELPSMHLDCTNICKANFGLPATARLTYDDLVAAVHPEDRDAMHEEVQRALREQDGYRKEYRVIWPDLTLHWILASGRANYASDGNPINMVGVTLDITERKTAEQQRERLLLRTQAARAEAEAASRLKDDFLATVSHELRTPLMSILGWTSLMRTGQVDGDMTAVALETIERNARSQSQLINDLLDVSSIISGKLRLDKRPIEFRPVVAAAIEVARPTAEEKGVILQTNIDDGAGLIDGDPERLQQVVWNLLSNAIKFTPEGGEVRIHLRQDATQVELTVSDTGRGISHDFIEHVFDRFRQADQTSKRSYGGLGLGLSIVRQLVDLHEGTIVATSEGEGKGATFTVHLPLLDAVVHEQAEAHPAANPDGRTPASPRTLDHLRVLIVEDEPDTRLVLKSALERHGSRVQTAASVEEAMELFESWNPNVLVSDIGLPGEDGYSLITRVRKMEDGKAPAIPALALTAYVREEDRVKALEAGFQAHVGKPLQPDEFVAAVADLASPVS